MVVTEHLSRRRRLKRKQVVHHSFSMSNYMYYKFIEFKTESIHTRKQTTTETSGT